MYWLVIAAIILMILSGICIYYYMNRTFMFWCVDKEPKWMKAGIIIISIFLAGSCWNPFGMPALIIYHILGIFIVLDLINFLLNKIGIRKKYPMWQKISGSGVLPLVLTGVILVCGHVRMLDVQKKEYTVYTEKQILKQDGYKVAYLSDLHFGTTMKKEKLKKYCDEISEQTPDLVILGGDIVDEKTSKKDMELAFQLLGSIRSQYGEFYVYGNHDRADYSNTAEFDVKDLNDTLDKNKIYCLADEVYLIQKDLLLVGRNDRGYGTAPNRETTEQILSLQDKARFILLADHQPIELAQNAAAGVDLQLSGHTHGGQIWPVGLVSSLLGFGEVNYGEKQIGDFTVIVSSGMAGWGYPIRTGHDSEYLIINIKNHMNSGNRL